jgi:hypothetical protein
MKKNQTFTLVLFAVVVFFILGIALGKYSSNAMALKTPNVACAVTMTKIIQSAKGDVYNMADVTNYVTPQSYDLASYSVQGDAISNPIFDSVPDNLKAEQKDYIDQKKAWQIFAHLIPIPNREMLAQYKVFTDGYSNTLAAVDQIPADPSKWLLEIDVSDVKDKNALTFTLIHEYAQMTPDQEIVDDPTNQDLQKQKAAACPSYFTGMGCSHADSYINAFYNRFWENVNDEWQKVDALQYGTDDQTPYYNGLYAFYKEHQDQFVDDYATTHPDEDIAESFAYFVFSPKPTGNSIKEQKVAFFYKYPELVELRANILDSFCTSLPR